jgi:hypothetical protein
MYNAIAIGARCAGATTAMLLARHGQSEYFGRSSFGVSTTNRREWRRQSQRRCRERSYTPPSKASRCASGWDIDLL